MKRSFYFFIIASFTAGAIASWFVAGSYWSGRVKDSHKDAPEVAHNEMIMNGMTSALKNKKGVEFDNEFLHEMTMHHAGAIEMAKLAKENSSMEEIKTLSDAIIKTQGEEIKLMETWHEKVHKEAEGLH
jgi:uncharacterized protein (DUF305 family)